MRLVKIFSQGKILNQDLYDRLQKWDMLHCFPGCGNEFLHNRDWWVILDDGKIIAYCGCIYSCNVCIFNRAWVHKNYRGLGLQRKMIKARINAAYKNDCYVCVTYTTPCNTPSANNLIKTKFLLFDPEYKYAGKGMLYFRKKL